jgi:hypothetical protein
MCKYVTKNKTTMKFKVINKSADAMKNQNGKEAK